MTRHHDGDWGDVAGGVHDMHVGWEARAEHRISDPPGSRHAGSNVREHTCICTCDGRAEGNNTKSRQPCTD